VAVVEGVVELMVVVVVCKSWVVAFREGPSFRGGPSCLVVASFQGEPFQAASSQEAREASSPAAVVEEAEELPLVHRCCCYYDYCYQRDVERVVPFLEGGACPGAKSCQEEEPYREAVVVAEGPFQVDIGYCCRVLPAAALGA